MISLDISLVWVIINLLVLYLLLKKFLFKPVCKMMDERSAKIQSDLDGAAQAKADAEKMKSDYEAEIADAHSQAAKDRFQEQFNVFGPAYLAIVPAV